MKMKKIIFTVAMVFTLFLSCNPLEDINNDADAQDNPVVGNTEYTFTDDDYDSLDLNFGSFNSVDEAKTLIPGFLAGTYPFSFWGQGSSVLVNYKLYIGNAFDIRDYNLDQDDYTFSGSNGLGFSSDANPQDYLADILNANVTTASQGDYRRAKYFQYTGDFVVVTPTVSLDQNFNYGATAGDLTAVSAGAWTSHSGAGVGPIGYVPTSLSMTDYPSSDIGGSITLDGVAGVEDLNVEFTPITSGTVYTSTLINLSAVGAGTYFFHFMDAEFGYSARVGAKDNGSGKISFGIGASSSTLTYGSAAFDLNTTYLLVASYNIETGVSNLYILTAPQDTEPTSPVATNTGSADLIAQKIGVRQGGGGPTGTMDGIRVANTWSSIMSNESLPDEIVGDKVAGEKYYEFNGEAWVLPSSNFYALTNADFASMNLTSFGSSTAADDYLPTFLGLKYPYAQEGDTMNIGYNYVSSSSGSGARGNLYTFMDGRWTAYQSTVPATLQFGFENGAWIPDNTIRYTLTNPDYVYIGNTLASDPAYSNKVATLINYFDYDYTWSEAEIIYSLGVFLDNYAPGAADGQKYLITYLKYDSGIQTLTARLIKSNGEWIAN